MEGTEYIRRLSKINGKWVSEMQSDKGDALPFNLSELKDFVNKCGYMLHFFDKQPVTEVTAVEYYVVLDKGVLC